MCNPITIQEAEEICKEVPAMTDTMKLNEILQRLNQTVVSLPPGNVYSKLRAIALRD